MTHDTVDIDTPHWTGVDPCSPWVSAARELTPELDAIAVAHDRTGAFVKPAFDVLREGRFLSMLVPKELGGGGASFAETCATLAELARGCPATSLTLSMHMHLVAARCGVITTACPRRSWSGSPNASRS